MLIDVDAVVVAVDDVVDVVHCIRHEKGLTTILWFLKRGKFFSHFV